MSRHRDVKRMINKGTYEDDSFEENDEEDPYADINFDQAELETIKNMVQVFDDQITRKQVIDALYHADGDHEQAYNKLFQIVEKKQKSSKKPSKKDNKREEQKQQKQWQQIVPEVPLNKKQNSIVQPTAPNNLSTEEQKAPSFQNFDLVRYNSEYPPIKYNNDNLEHRDYINLVVVGHVDSGKSTLIGKLLHLLCIIDDRAIHRTQKEAKRVGKESFLYAFFTDESQQERDKGITMDMGYKMLKLNDKYLNLLDSPGHKDFVPHMITGACQADYAILVIDASTNSFEAGYQRGGQTKEHSYLIRALGVSQMIVAINKMDMINWNQERFEFIKNEMSYFLQKIGFKENKLTFIPFSAFNGENLKEKSLIKEFGWYAGPSIFEAIDQFQKPVRSDNKPTRLMISNCYTQHEGQLRGDCLFGKIDSGRIVKGQKYTIMPSGIQCSIKDIFVHDQKVKEAGSGSLIDCSISLKLQHELPNITAGDVLCSFEYPIPISNLFLCEIYTLEIDCPLIKGEQVVVHINGARVSGIIKKLIKILDKKGNLTRKFPRTIGPSECAEVEVETQGLIPMEIFKNSRSFGRVILRQNMNTLAIGKISEIKFNKDILKQTQSEMIENEQNLML